MKSVIKKTMLLRYHSITVSGKIAVGTSTLSTHLKQVLGWKYINAGEIQRAYDRQHHIHESRQGALSRSDSHEREIEAMTKRMLLEEKHIIYEAWLAGFMAQKITGILNVLLICSEDSVRIDRVVNRENISVEEAKISIKNREHENIVKWEKLYGNYDFWNPRYYNLIIDTYKSGPMETLGKTLDTLGYKGSHKISQ